MDGRWVENLRVETEGMEALDYAPNPDSATKGDVKRPPLAKATTWYS
jgi:hypothetical protein